MSQISNIPTQEDLDQLRNDATVTAADLYQKIENFCVSHQDLNMFEERLFTKMEQKLNRLFTSDNKGYMPQEEQEYERLVDTPRPLFDNHSTTSSVRYDADHDVIMKTAKLTTNLISQVPEPGFFNGDTTQTELFCELCESTFKTYPNNCWPEEARINFVQSRLRDNARNWYLMKYKDNTAPATMNELLDGLKTAFNNAGNNKLAKIKLVSLKQNYGNVNQYIDDFRNYSSQFNLGEEALTLENLLYIPVEETVAKADYDKVVSEYEKLVKAFNKLMKNYNDLFIAQLFTEDK